jgi:hypothetical protein
MIFKRIHENDLPETHRENKEDPFMKPSSFRRYPLPEASIP